MGRRTRQGLPAATTLSGISWVTTLPAPDALVNIQRIDCLALLPQSERDKSVLYKFVHVGQKLGTFGWIETGQLLQNHFLQGKLHVQKLCRIVGIHSVLAEEKIHLYKKTDTER